MIERDRLDQLPASPGVYLLKDAKGDILYIGKANALRTRVRSYFRDDPDRGVRLRELARRAEEVETIVVGSEAEALVLEANLIKEHQPRFNIRLRDDKRYPFIRVTLQEPFPRVLVTRRMKSDGARHFGPFTDVGSMRRALEVVKRLYTVRSCTYDLPREAPPRPCLDHHIGRCLAPCVGLQSEAEYREMIGEVVRILEGRTGEVRERVEQEMTRAAGQLRFEEAARHRDVLRGLDAIAHEQRVEQVEGGSRDVLGFARDGPRAVGVLLRVRKGTLLGRESHRFEGLDEEGDGELLGRFTAHLYLARGEIGDADLPREILLPFELPDGTVLEEVLGARAGAAVRLQVPLRGEKRRLVELAASNARHLLEERVVAEGEGGERAEEVLYELQERLGLKVVPRLIVCFDVSHTQGSELVASAVAFENGEPRRSLYRHMRIRGEWRNDDVRSMAEAVERYLTRRIDEGEPLPELLLLDGGKGQLSAVAPVLLRVGAPEVALAALAKRNEELHLPDRNAPLRLSRRDPALRLLQRVRDEAHRVAVGYNRKLRSRRTIGSELAGIPGIGVARQRALLTRFGSVRALREASEDEIAAVPGFSRVLAARVLTYLGR